VSALRGAARGGLEAWHRARLQLWTQRTRRLLAAHGAELVVEAAPGVRLHGLPAVQVDPWGSAGAARTTIRLGPGVTVGRDVVLELHPAGTNVVELGAGTVLHDTVRLQVRDGAIRLGERTRVRSFAVLKADGELTTAGGNEISYGVVIHCADRVTLGRGTGLAERVSIIDSDHTVDGSDRDWYRAPLRLGPVVVEDNVFLAAGCVLTRGTRVGRNSLVAAGAVCTGRQAFPPSSLVAGAPARVVRELQAAPSSDA
jgi:carbonic anhydrase/acetyltransferase-like protein (isoleucine patch superfamily)